MEILPQTTQENEKIYLLDENIAICENGKILYYDILGHLNDTNYECVLNKHKSKYNQTKDYQFGKYNDRFFHY